MESDCGNGIYHNESEENRMNLEKVPERLAEASLAYKRALLASPEHPFIKATFVSFHVKKLFYELFENEEMQNQVERLIESTKTSVSALNPEFASEFMNVCAIYFCKIKENFEVAMEFFEKSLLLDQTNVDAFYNYATVLDQSMGSPGKACSLYYKVLELRPNHCLALNNLGALLVETAKKEKNEERAKNLDAAYGLFKRAQNLEPGLPAINLVCVCSLQNRKLEAKQWLEHAIAFEAIDSGEAGVTLLKEEQDLENIKNETWFSNILRKLNNQARTSLSDDGIDEADYNIEFSGFNIRIKQACLTAQADEISGTTGWTIWNSCFVLLRYLEEMPPNFFKERWILDLSGGLGLLGIACALKGAKCTITEVGSQQLCSINENLVMNRMTEVVKIKELAWGDLDALTSVQRHEVVIVSDLLYIAIRENLQKEFCQTLISLLQGNGTQIIMAYEERLQHEEGKIIRELEQVCAVTNLPVKESYLRDLTQSVENVDAGLGIETVFYENPVVKMVLLKME